MADSLDERVGVEGPADCRRVVGIFNHRARGFVWIRLAGDSPSYICCTLRYNVYLQKAQTGCIGDGPEIFKLYGM